MTAFVRFSNPLFRPSGYPHSYDAAAASAACGNAELPADVIETAAAFIFKFNVPGVSKEDISVDVDEKSIKVETTFKSAAAEGETVLRSERLTGSASRSFRLQQAIDADSAVATHENGVLTLTVQKKNVSPQKRVTIN